MVNGANTNHEAVNCEQVWREISNYVDGEVDAELRSAMEEHFRTCKHCASVLAGTRNVVQLYGDERMLEVPAGFSQRLENRLGRLEKSTDSSGSRWSSLSAWLVPLAAIALFTGALALVDQLSFKPPEKSILAEPGRDIPPDMLVVVSDGSKVFHVAGCPFIHDKATERTITAKQAMHDGYVPCSRCLRQYLKASATGQQDDDDASADAEEERGEVVSAAAH
ncbi:MAG: zf-HC2 domain-containing protein [Candidatus Sulfotelmatobacter sp.]